MYQNEGDKRMITAMKWITPYNMEKYRDMLENKYPNIAHFSQVSNNIRNTFKAKYME